MSTPSQMTVGGGLGKAHPDMLATSPHTGPAAGAGQVAAWILQRAKLLDLCETSRFRTLDRLEAYFRTKQDDHKRYDWDGYMGYGEEAPIKPGWYVPFKLRRPSARYDVARLIVTRLTAMLFGSDRFPEIRCEGDLDAEDYAKALCEASRLPARFMEARDLGGATGTACLSFSFVNGKPRVEVHNSKHCTVLSWQDEVTRRPRAVLKAYAYPRTVFDKESGKPKEVTFFYARFWDEQREIVWEPIPKQVAETATWTAWPARVVEHGYGFCPLYWIQNHPDSLEVDGASDYDGSTDLFDEINMVLSATAKGTKANAEPTLVIRAEPSMNDGSLSKGTGTAIFSPGGASYLEISGTSVEAGMKMFERLRACALERSSVVVADPNAKAGGVESAAHLRLTYAPMTAACDVLREQYGENGVKTILLDMLRVARMIAALPPVPVTLPDGTVELRKPSIDLPPRLEEVPDEEPEEEEEEEEEETTDPAKPTPPPKAREEREFREVERKPGKSEHLILNWNPYFSPTWDDIQKASVAATTANGGKPVLSQRTAVQALQSLWGISDVEAEMQQLTHEGDVAMKKAQEAFAATAKEDEDPDGGTPGERFA